MKSDKLLLSIMFMMAFVLVIAPMAYSQTILTFGSGTTVDIGSGSAIEARAGSLINASGSTIQGTGTLDVSENATFSNAGTINPGSSASAGILNIVGNFSQTPTGTLNIELGGTTPGTSYDQLVVSGSATLSGILVSLISSFSPDLGDSFEVIKYSSSSGSFNDANLPLLSSGREWDKLPVGSSSITLIVNPSGTNCTYSISPTSKTDFTATGGTGSVSTNTSSGCGWAVVNNAASWLTVTSGASGSGDGVVNYSVSENVDKDSRTGQLTIAGQTFTVIQQGTEVTDSVASTATVNFPSCDSYQFQVFEISGTASDDTALVELQITDGTWYVKNGNFTTRTPTWITVSGKTSWSINTSSVNWTPRLEYTIHVRTTDNAGNISSTSSTETCTFRFVNWESDTSLSINLSAQRILQRDTLGVSGKLTPLPDGGQSMAGLDITIDVTSPSGVTTSHTAVTNEFGQYTKDNIAGFNEEGTWILKSSFDGVQNLYKKSEPDSVSLLVGESAGYAIIVQGKIAGEEGIKSHNKTTNRIYDKFIERNFEPDDIYYFNYDTSQTIVDASPTRAGIQEKIETWAKNKLSTSPAPLYIVMINHGNIGKFHVGNEVITPADLDTWLDKLEGDLATDRPEALDKKRILFLGYCYSGSFINTLSRKGRIIVTSATKDEESYKGPGESDGIRSGEFFMEEFFKELGRGFSLKESFQKASDRTEDFTLRGGSSANTANKYFDNSVQHPLMDDDGDKVGTNEITEGSDDGKEAANIILGTGETVTNASVNQAADITDVTETQYLVSSATSAAMWATVDDESRVDAIWFEVRSPTKELSVVGSGVSLQKDVDLIRTFLVYNGSTQRFEGSYSGFNSSGMWEVYYFVKDSKTGEISPMVRSVVYKSKTDNNSPGAFNLKSPDNGKKEHTALIFEWGGSTDPDGDNVTYNLLIATDNRFRLDDIVYREEEITTTATIVDKDVVLENGDVGLSDLTTYYWKAQAVDGYGSVTDSSQTWSFNTDNTNFGTGFITGIIYDDTYFEPIAGVEISTDLGGIDMSIVDGFYFMEVSDGTHKVTAEYNNYENASFPGIEVSFGRITKLNIPMQGTNPAPDIKANNSDGPVTIGTNETLSVEIRLGARDGKGKSGDWWVVVNTPAGEFEYYDLNLRDFTSVSSVTHKGTLFDLGTTEILNTSGLGAGTYTYYFGVDMVMNGTLDTGEGQFFFDIVEVTVKTAPLPQIYANGSEGSVTISTGEQLAIAVSLASGDYSDTDADWWVVADTPYGWLYLAAKTMLWGIAGTSYTDLLVTHQGALLNLDTTEIFNMSGLGAGTYTFYFGVDLNKSGTLDMVEGQFYYASVVVNVK